MARTRKPPAQTQEERDQALVQAVLNETKPGEDEHRSRCSRYDKSYEVYRASARARTDAWQSKIRAKYGMQTIDTAMVNMAQGKPRCKIVARSPDYDETARGFERVFDYYIAKDHLPQKNPATIQQALIYGVTVGKNHWLYKTTTRMRRYQADDGFGNPVLVAAPQEVVLRDGPSFEPWDIYDAWWDPDARSVDDARYVALRSWLSKRQLLDNACTVPGNHPPEDCNGIYHNVDELLRTGIANRQTSTAQESFLGGNANLRKDRFEIVEYWWDDNTLTVIGNKQIPLRVQANPHWHGQKPVVVATCRPDLFKMQGIPETELVADLQEALWTIENMRFDNLHLTVMRGITYREGGVIDPNALELMPRFKWPVTDHDDIKFQEVQPLPPEAYQEEQELLGRMRDITGITPYITGAALDQTDQNTATGISILNNAATAILRFKSQQVQYGVWQRSFEQWGDDIQQFMDTPVWVKITGPGNTVDWHQYGPQEVVGDYDFILQGTEESISKAQERQEALALLNAFAPLAQTGIVNFKPLLERVASAFGFDNPEELFLTPVAVGHAAPAPPPPQNGNGNGGGQMLLGNRPLPIGVQQAVGQQ